MQIFTKGPQRWAERRISGEEASRFRRARAEAGVGIAGAHDSYLINLATSDPELLAKSIRAFRAEMDRCDRLGLDFLVTHPGNATAGSREAGLRQNAELIAEALDERPGDVRVLIETTAGAGSALGCRFEEIAAMIDRVPAEHRARLGVCLDTAHVFAAGYDLRGDYEGVFETFDDVLGLETLGLIHCNDSLGTLGSRRDRHADIGAGELGAAPFRALMSDPRLREVPRVIETPKGGDPIAADRRNLQTLRRLARA